jgi:hypothetical protein
MGCSILKAKICLLNPVAGRIQSQSMASLVLRKRVITGKLVQELELNLEQHTKAFWANAMGHLPTTPTEPFATPGADDSHAVGQTLTRRAGSGLARDVSPPGLDPSLNVT